MDPQRWLDEVRKELQTRRLPKRYVTRLMRELSDHVLDGWEKTMNKDVRVFAGPHDQLGSPRQVADTAEKEFQSRRFAARHPLVSFGLLPVLVFPFVATAVFVGPGWVIATLLEVFLGENAVGTTELAWAPTAAKTFAAGTIILAAAIVVWTMTWIARRAGVHRKWPITSAILVALVAGGIFSDATPKTPEKPGMLMVGLGFPLRPWTAFQTAQLVAPLAFAAWLIRVKRPSTAPPIELASAA